jgi:hypothetical protein
MYERGWFEYSALQNADGVLRMPQSEPTLFAGCQQPAPEPGWHWCELEKAASDLNHQAISLLPHLDTLRAFAENDLYTAGMRKLWRGLSGYQTLLKAVYRAQVIHYELKDAFLRVTAEHEQTFRGHSERLVRGVRVESDYRTIGKNIHKLFKSDTGIKWDPALYSSVTDEFLLRALCGINAYYRQHSSDAYLAGLALLRPIELYIRDERQHSKNRPSLGLLGLAAYLRGRLRFGLSQYAEARDAWIESCECYAQKIEQKQEKLLTGDEQEREKWNDTRSLCLRRSALASAMGNGYLLLVMSKLSACLEVVVLSRAVLTKSCGAVYAAYVDLIYAAAKRAKHSSELSVLQDCERLLERCRETFRTLVRDSHYVERANIELALVFHYKAKALDRLSHEGAPTRAAAAQEINRLYTEAIDNLTSAIEYAEGQKDISKLNPRMIAEAYAIRSHVWRHRPVTDMEHANHPGWLAALKDGLEALKHVGEMSQLECEARMALGAAYISIAEGLKSGKIPVRRYRELAERAGVPMRRKDVQGKAGSGRRKPRQVEPRVASKTEQLKDEEIWLNKQDADRELSRAFEINDEANPRISAICYLRLAQSALLRETTLPDAWFYFRQYQSIADRVEHAFCHEQAEVIENELQRLGQYFFVDMRQGDLYLDGWKEKLENHIYSETINRIVEDRRVVATHSAIGQRRGRKATEVSTLIKEIMKYTGVSEGTARTLVEERLDDIRNRLKAVGADVDDIEDSPHVRPAKEI